MDNNYKEIYILQTHTGTIPSKVVRLFTKYEYSHILISLDNTFTKMYSFGRKTLNNPLNGGFVIENISGKLFTKFHNTFCRIYKLKITRQQFIDLSNELKIFEDDRDEYKYDFLGIFTRYIHHPIKRNYYYVCSQFVAEVLSKANIYTFDKPFEDITPQDFESIPNTEIVYIGKLNQFEGIKEA